jgi:Asp-tRNA(Asn)/Glu-tRNA(Gln) amidotransferase A subunit family amidase
VEQLADLCQRPLGGVLELSAALHELSAAELAAAFAAGQASPVEALEAVLAHIARWEPQLCALYACDPEAARAAARASQARWRAGQPLSALDGVPVTIKENIASRGVPLPLGTAATELVPAAEDAPPTARLREAGCVILAKTTMPDWGMLSSGLSSFHRLARNPWDLRLNPGGSSAGAGAAAAAGYGPLHVGTDIGGSIRLPAAWCGVFGFKPSLGRIPIKPPFAGRVAGPMTRTVTDAALMMAALARPDWRDTMSLPAQGIDWGALELDVRGLRLALQLDAGWGLPVEPETLAAVRAAARAFEAAGAVVEEIGPFTTREMMDGLDRFWRMRSWLDYSALPRERQDKVLAYIRAWIEPAAGYSAAQVFRGYSQMGAMREAAVAATQRFDFVLSPTSPVASFPAEWAGPTNDPAHPLEHIGYTVPYNMSEQPAASIGCGHGADGRPIGLQIAGRRHDDLGVLRLARAWERLRPPPRPWPTPPEPAPGHAP